MSIFPVNINVSLPSDPKVLKLLEQIMSVLTDKLSSIDAKVDATASSVTDGFARQAAIIADLNTKMGDVPTPEDLAKLDSIESRLDTLKSTADATAV